MLIHSPHFVWQGIVLLVLWVVAVRATASTADDLCKAVALAVGDALNAAHIDAKVAADCMGLKLSRFYLQLHGDPENPIALWRLLRLPFPFWMSFAPWLLYRVGQQRMNEFAETFRSVRS